MARPLPSLPGCPPSVSVPTSGGRSVGPPSAPAWSACVPQSASSRLSGSCLPHPTTGWPPPMCAPCKGGCRSWVQWPAPWPTWRLSLAWSPRAARPLRRTLACPCREWGSVGGQRCRGTPSTRTSRPRWSRRWGASAGRAPARSTACRRVLMRRLVSTPSCGPSTPSRRSGTPRPVGRTARGAAPVAAAGRRRADPVRRGRPLAVGGAGGPLRGARALAARRPPPGPPRGDNGPL